eukprot:5846045-Amphidinium_carterae.1
MHAAEPLKSDREIVLTAVAGSGLALEYAAEKLKGDREVVLTAVKDCSVGGFALHYAAETLKSDRDFMLTAVAQNGAALQYVADDLLEDLRNNKTHR